jgi:multidrug resistance efflux pump
MPPLPPVAGLTVHGIPRHVLSWSVEGFRLDAPAKDLPPGALVDGRLALGRTAQVELRLSLRVDSTQTYLVITDPTPEQSALLHRLGDDSLSSGASALLDLLDGEETTSSSSFRVLRWLRSLVVIGFGMMLLGAVLWVLYLTLSTVSPRYAAISTFSTNLNTPFTGTVETLLVSPGSQVSPGDPIATLSQPAVRLETIRLSTMLVEAKGEVALLEARFADLSLVQTRLQTLQEQRSLLEAEQTLLSQQIALAQAEADRLTRADTLVTQDRRHDANQYLLSLQQRSTTLARSIADLDEALSLRAMGLETPDLRDNAVTLQTLQARLDTAKETVSHLETSLDALAQSTLLISPCACVVHLLHYQPGEQAIEGTPFLTLVSPDPPFLQALVVTEDARFLRLGDTAQVTLADGTTGVGVVVDISYTPQAPNRVGLPDRIFSQERYARLDIAMDNLRLEDLEMVAEVRLFSRGLLHWLGLDLLRERP